MRYYFLLFFISIYSPLFSQKSNPTEKIDSVSYYSNLANTNVSENKYRNALVYTQKAINYSKVKNNSNDQTNQTYRLGKLYYDVKKYDEAISVFNKNISLYKSLKTTPSPRELYTYYYLGLSYIKKENFSNARNCLDKAQSLNETLKINYINDLLNLQRGIIYKLKGNIDVASSIFTAIIAKPDNTAIMDTKAEALYQMGNIEMTHNRNNLALNYLNKALSLNAKNDNMLQKSNILLSISNVYEKMLDKNSAYTYLKLHTNLKENIALLDNEKLGIDDYENFKESERLKEQAKIQKENIQKEKASKFSKLISILAIALISILSLLSLSLYKNNIIRTRSNQLLEEKNRELILA
ncbi:MAG TPA: hybrid sensor histidine kinase/response regulator, partial [Flavobacterium sp.]